MVRETWMRHSPRFVRDIDIGDGSSKSQPVSSHPPVCERVARSRTRRQDGHIWVGGVPTPRAGGKSPTKPVRSFLVLLLSFYVVLLHSWPHRERDLGRGSDS